VTADATGVCRFKLLITADVDVEETITAAATTLRYEPGTSYFDGTNSVKVKYAGIP
jgi:hypothetical protein